MKKYLPMFMLTFSFCTMNRNTQVKKPEKQEETQIPPDPKSQKKPNKSGQTSSSAGPLSPAGLIAKPSNELTRAETPQEIANIIETNQIPYQKTTQIVLVTAITAVLLKFRQNPSDLQRLFQKNPIHTSHFSHLLKVSKQDLQKIAKYDVKTIKTFLESHPNLPQFFDADELTDLNAILPKAKKGNVEKMFQKLKQKNLKERNIKAIVKEAFPEVADQNIIITAWSKKRNLAYQNQTSEFFLQKAFQEITEDPRKKEKFLKKYEKMGFVPTEDSLNDLETIQNLYTQNQEQKISLMRALLNPLEEKGKTSEDLPNEMKVLAMRGKLEENKKVILKKINDIKLNFKDEAIAQIYLQNAFQMNPETISIFFKKTKKRDKKKAYETLINNFINSRTDDDPNLIEPLNQFSIKEFKSQEEREQNLKALEALFQMQNKSSEKKAPDPGIIIALENRFQSREAARNILNIFKRQ